MGLLPGASFSSVDVVRAIMLFASLGGSTVLWANTNYSSPPPTSFTFHEAIPKTGSSINLGKVNGKISAVGWSEPYVLINGTITVMGEGANPDKVILYEQNDAGAISFTPFYNDTTPGRDYTIDVNLFLPLAVNFSSIALEGIGPASIQMGPISAHSIWLETWSGKIDMTLRPAQGGDYGLTTHASGGDVDLKVYQTASFQIQASSYTGQVTVKGFTNCQLDNSVPYAAFGSQATITCGGYSTNISVKTYTAEFSSGNITIESI